MGHALDNTMQDILIRYKRMQGYNALWVPGTDHAAISTEVKVTNQLKEEGIDKKELGREKVPGDEPGSGKKSMRGTIEGAAWRNWAYPVTGTENVSPWTRAALKAVEEVFISLYEEGIHL